MILHDLFSFAVQVKASLEIPVSIEACFKAAEGIEPSHHELQARVP